MASRKDLKKTINNIASELFTECMFLKGTVDADKQEAADKAEKDDDASWKKIKFAESQLVVMNEAVKEGKHVIGLTVTVQESCILKAARAFLVSLFP